MNKQTENQRQNTYAASDAGRFDVAIKKTDIIAKGGEGFTFHYPYGIIGIKSDPDSIVKFIELLKKFNLDENSDESVMDCHVDRKALEKGGNVVWEAPRYGMKKSHITLGEWLEEGGIIIEEETSDRDVIRLKDRRREIEGVVKANATGTHGL